MPNQLAILAAALEDRYTVERELGRGGMATVYLARDLKHRRNVAVKVLAPELSTSLAAERFLREIEIASGLTHPNILPVYDSGVAEEMLYYVMPYVEDESLAHAMAQEGALPLEFALQVTREVAAALDYAHRRDVVHRDIKPANILLVDGHAVVADFGIARAVGAAGGYTLTQAGLPLGTPKYMSPEQALGATDVDGRSDIYSLGRVVYEMIIGEPPVRACDGSAVNEGRFSDLPHHHEATFKTLPDRVVRGLVRALAERPEDRFATAGEFAHRMAPPQRGTKSWRAIDETTSALPRAYLIATVAFFVLAAVVAFGGQLGGLPPATIAVVALSLLAFAGGTLLWGRRARQSPFDTPAQRSQPAPGRISGSERRTLETIDSIAVLPFVDMSPGQDQEYFSDGISEELLNALARIDGLRVAARTSSFHFKGQNVDVREIGEKLGVVTILEGSVRKSDTRARITAQLINVDDGFHLWSDTYDREIADVFAVQQEIAGKIVDSLRLKLPPTGAAQITRTAPPPEAHNLYFQGRFSWNKRTKDGLMQAAEYFRQAVELDPAYAAAHAGLADAYLLLGSYHYMSPNDALPRAKQAAERALSLDDALAEAHATRGQVLRSELDWLTEEREYLRAIELNPSYATAHQWYATALAGRGDTARALKEIRLAEELDPLSPAVSVTVAIILFLNREYETALAQLEKTSKLAPDFFTAHTWLAVINAELGRAQEARSAAQRARELREKTGLTNLAMISARLGQRDEALHFVREAEEQGHRPWAALATVHAALGDREQAFVCLERAFAEEGWSFFTLHRTLLLYLNVWPWFDAMRDDPRFQDFVARLKLPS